MHTGTSTVECTIDNLFTNYLIRPKESLLKGQVLVENRWCLKKDIILFFIEVQLHHVGAIIAVTSEISVTILAKWKGKV